MAFMEGSELDQGLRKIVTRAMTDPAFREVCLQDPASAYTQATGYTLPKGSEALLALAGAHPLGTLLIPFAAAASGARLPSVLLWE
jgi:hypothetical protein